MSSRGIEVPEQWLRGVGLPITLVLREPQSELHLLTDFTVLVDLAVDGFIPSPGEIVLSRLHGDVLLRTWEGEGDVVGRYVCSWSPPRLPSC